MLTETGGEPGAGLQLIGGAPHLMHATHQPPGAPVLHTNLSHLGTMCDCTFCLKIFLQSRGILSWLTLIACRQAAPDYNQRNGGYNQGGYNQNTWNQADDDDIKADSLQE